MARIKTYYDYPVRYRTPDHNQWSLDLHRIETMPTPGTSGTILLLPPPHMEAMSPPVVRDQGSTQDEEEEGVQWRHGGGDI